MCPCILRICSERWPIPSTSNFFTVSSCSVIFEAIWGWGDFAIGKRLKSQETLFLWGYSALNKRKKGGFKKSVLIESLWRRWGSVEKYATQVARFGRGNSLMAEGQFLGGGELCCIARGFLSIWGGLYFIAFFFFLFSMFFVWMCVCAYILVIYREKRKV